MRLRERGDHTVEVVVSGDRSHVRILVRPLLRTRGNLRFKIEGRLIEEILGESFRDGYARDERDVCRVCYAFKLLHAHHLLGCRTPTHLPHNGISPESPTI